MRNTGKPNIMMSLPKNHNVRMSFNGLHVLC